MEYYKIMDEYLKETQILNFSEKKIQELIQNHKWIDLEEVARVKSIYDYVRDEIQFGYNSADDLTALEVLNDGYGQCNTKANLLMALFRATGIPCRLHGFYVDKILQKGIISGIFYALTPKDIVHSWVEVFVNDHWYVLEGVILDKAYLTGLQKKFSHVKNDFCLWGVCVENFEKPVIDWDLNHTYIQSKSITKDLGTFQSPDEFYTKHQQKLGAFKIFLYQNFVRHILNRNVEKIRKGV